MRSSSSMRTAAHRNGARVVARSATTGGAMKTAPTRATPRQIVHVIDETSEATSSVSRRSSLLAASGALISTLAISTLAAGPAEALGWVLWLGSRNCCRWLVQKTRIAFFFFFLPTSTSHFRSIKISLPISLLSLSLFSLFSLSLSIS